MAKSEHTLIHDMKGKTSQVPVAMLLVIIVAVLALGVLTGFGASKAMGGQKTANAGGSGTVAEEVNEENKVGVKDTKVFPDTAEGTLREGGFEGEGSFHLERPGGESQNVYLTSSTVDLSQFIGKKVMVLGKTFEAEKAGWLMDVGYLEVK